jgi:hypothetical protein
MPIALNCAKKRAGVADSRDRMDTVAGERRGRRDRALVADANEIPCDEASSRTRAAKGVERAPPLRPASRPHPLRRAASRARAAAPAGNTSRCPKPRAASTTAISTLRSSL